MACTESSSQAFLFFSFLGKCKIYWVPNAYYSPLVCLSNGLLLETVSQFVRKLADLFIFRTYYQKEFKLEIWFRDGIQNLQVSCHYRWPWEERNAQVKIFSKTGTESFKHLDLGLDAFGNIQEQDWDHHPYTWRVSLLSVPSALVIGPAVTGGVSMGWEDKCPLPQCWPEPLDAAEIGAAVLELTVLRVQALCPSDKQRGWCYFLRWGKSCTSKWKWILRRAGWQNDVCQPCLCWYLMTEDSVVAEKDGLCFWSFTVLWTVPCFALFSFLWKLLPLPSFHFLRNTQNQRTWSGHPVYSLHLHGRREHQYICVTATLF